MKMISLSMFDASRMIFSSGLAIFGDLALKARMALLLSPYGGSVVYVTATPVVFKIANKNMLLPSSARKSAVAFL